FPGQPFHNAAIVAFAEIGGDGLYDRVTDLIERIHFGDRIIVALGDFQPRIMEGLPRAVAACERKRSRFTDMPYAERIDEAIQRNLAPLFDGLEQIANRRFAIALLIL